MATKCPRCFNVLPSDQWAFTERDPASTAVDPEASAFKGHPVMMGTIARVERNPGIPMHWEPDLAEVSAQLEGPAVEVCPICHYELPPNWRRGHATCLAMAGARFTGKTVYIAVMIKRLQRHLEQMGQTLDFANAETQHRYREEYEKPLFEERGLIQATQSARVEGSHQHDPLVFSIGRWNDVPHYLAIRDVAGEDLEDPAVGGQEWSFFAAADAVLFLFDPMRVQEVKDQLRDLVPTDHRTGGDPRDVLRSVMRLMGNGTPWLAVILSKFDALQELRKVSGSSWGQVMSHAGAAFTRDPSLLRGGYDEVDGQLLDAEVRSLLQRLDAGPTLYRPSNPTTGGYYQSRFFAVSALGSAPQGNRVGSSGISPFRCMDPVRWVLTHKGVL